MCKGCVEGYLVNSFRDVECDDCESLSVTSGNSKWLMNFSYKMAENKEMWKIGIFVCSKFEANICYDLIH